MLEQLRIHQQIIYDLAVQDLEPMSGCYERLAFLAGLRDPLDGQYTHPYLCSVYEPSRVHQALAKCHREIFERLLESNLETQREDLLSYIARPRRPAGECSKLSQQETETWIPPDAPDYLKELFRSNQAVLRELLQLS